MKYFIFSLAFILMDVVAPTGCHRDDDDDASRTEQVEETPVETPADSLSVL